MKNIHVSRTDKPSRLYKCRFKGHFILDPMNDLDGCFEEGFDPQNIYITNDEEIKEGDWFIFKDDNTYLFQSIGNTDDTHIKVKSNNKYGYGDWNKDYAKKIILTTDQDLIKDGVQAIEDEFLEWFVKNSSCEEVDIFISRFYFREEKDYYKIIIPKEEPKQETTLEDKLKLLVEEWRKKQIHYEEVAEDNITSKHNNRKFTYKAMATRDCWKELLKLIEDEK